MAAFDNINSLQKKFINNGFPYFSIYENGLRSFSNILVDDIEEASEILKDELLDFEKSPTAYDSKIAIYTSDNKLFIQKSALKDLKEKCSAALTVRFLDQRQANNNNSGAANLQVLQILQEMRNDMNIQREKIASLEAELQDDDDEDDDDSNPIIGALKSNPELMNTIVTGAMAALGNIFKKPSTITALGSIIVDQDEKLTKSIEILKANDEKLSDHLEILANMSIENPGQFKWLISMLK
jgi:hypothetical protein